MIERLFTNLKPVIVFTIRHPFTILGVSFLTAAVGFIIALNLHIDNDLARLVPGDYPSVQALEKLRDQVGAENELAVAIESPSFEANKQFANDLIPRALNLINPATNDPWFTRAEFRKEIDFLEKNALYFATSEELDKLEHYLGDRISQAKKEANPFYFELEEEDASVDSLVRELEQLYDDLIGSEYPVSADSSILVVRFFPSGSQTDIAFIREVYAEMQHLVDEMNPSGYNAQMRVTLAGRLLRTLIEVETIMADVKDSFGTGVLMLMAVVILYFLVKSYRITAGPHLNFKVLFHEIGRSPALILIMGLPLIFSLCWTFGIAYLVYGSLNLMTSTLGLLLFGMGIDFGIHFFARYTEERGAGRSVEQSIITTFMTTGQAVSVVGITTAAAFFILILADFKGFSEFGFIAGIGILFAILAYIIFLPSLLSIFERFHLLNLRANFQRTEQRAFYKAKPNSPRRPFRSWTVIIAAAAITLYTAINIFNLRFEYNFGVLEPDYVRYDSLNSKVRQVYNDRRTRNAAYIITDSPSDAQAVAEALRWRTSSDTLTPTINRVEVFQDRFPMTETLETIKLGRIAGIRILLNDPFLRDQEDKQLNQLKQAASTKKSIPLQQVPDFIRRPFTSKSGAIGTLVIIYPSVGLSDGRNSINFADDVGKVTVDKKTYYAGSTSIVAADMLRLMTAEAPLMILLTILVIIIFKWFILRRLKWILLALIPLAMSYIWMFGLMSPLGWKLNFYNMVVLPTVLGIGDDSGIHIVHRYLEEGTGSMDKVLRTTGEHISISAITTVLGFGGLLFSIHPGMRSIGELAILGILLTLVGALFVLPAIVRVTDGMKNEKDKVELKHETHKIKKVHTK